MESLMFALNAVLPIILMVVAGYLLKRCGLMKADLAKPLNKLVFRVFLPVMLFLNVYKIENLGQMDFGYIIFVIVIIAMVFGISIPVVLCVTQKGEQRGALLQASFRSNYALIGIPLAQSLFGEAGVAVATLLSAVVIPLFNVLAVISLSVFRQNGKKTDVKKILSDIFKITLIQSIAAGLIVLGIRTLFVRWGIVFCLKDIKPVYKVLEYLSGMATPMALLVLGVQFEFSAVASLKREILYGTLARTLFVPLLGIGIAYLPFRDSFSGAHFAAFVAVFATPVAVSSVPMAQEMDSDVILAGQLVVWTTLFSALSVFLASFLLKFAGVFS